MQTWKRSNRRKRKKENLVFHHLNLLQQGFSSLFIWKLYELSVLVLFHEQRPREKVHEKEMKSSRNTFRVEISLLMRFYPHGFNFHSSQRGTSRCRRWKALELIRSRDVYENKIYGFLSIKMALRSERNWCEKNANLHVHMWKVGNHWFR